MPAERAGYTVTMFLIDVSPSMGNMRAVHLPGQETTREMTSLEWGLQFVKLKIQEMIYNGRKTDKCGVILFGSEDTDNIINDKDGGYEHVTEYIPIAQPNSGTLAKIDAIEPSTIAGDSIDALIVGIQTQDVFLGSKKTWTRKIVVVTDGESPMEVEDWKAVVEKIDDLSIGLTIVGIDFDDDELPYHEENKPNIKSANETFYHTLTTSISNGIVGTCALALREATRPDIKQTKSVLGAMILRLGDVEVRPEEALEISIKTSKCTALSRPKAWKKFSLREEEEEEDETAMDQDDGKRREEAIFAPLRMRSEYYIDRREGREEEEENDSDDQDGDGDYTMKNGKSAKDSMLEKVEDEQRVRGYKYGSTYVPCPDNDFPRLKTTKGIDICGFFQAKNFRRELSMGEIQYVWADPSQPLQQVALSSIVQAMYEKGVMAIARWVTKDGMDPKMGVLAPTVFEKVDCLLWVQMPFADDVRKYTFASLDHLVSRKGEVITSHPYIPTTEQLAAMDKLVDAMDLMEAGEKDEDGNRASWFDTRLSYNPAIYRVKQAQFHSAIVSDVVSNPISPPHPELLKYFDPPKKALKRARQAIEECREAFNVKEVPKKLARQRKDGHVLAQGDDNEMLLLDRKLPSRTSSQAQLPVGNDAADSATESENEDEALLLTKPQNSEARKNGGEHLPTPERSVSPPVDPGRAPGRIIGSTYPLADFQRNIAKGDIVSKAVEDLSAVVIEIVLKPFSSRRSSELLECMKVLRDVSLKEDEIDAWNDFLPRLKDACMSEPGNRAFWSQVRDQGPSISFISDTEAVKYGGKSAITDRERAELLTS